MSILFNEPATATGTGVTLGVTKFIIVTNVILVTLCSAATTRVTKFVTFSFEIKNCSSKSFRFKSWTKIFGKKD